MSEVVLDASVVLKWFAAEQRGSSEAGKLRDDYEAGRLSVVVPALLFLELLNVAGRRWRWDEEALLELAQALGDLSFEVGEPELQLVASWVAGVDGVRRRLCGAGRGAGPGSGDRRRDHHRTCSRDQPSACRRTTFSWLRWRNEPGQ